METIKEIDNFPAIGQSCVYFLLKDDCVIYVGQTVELKNRMVGHRNTKAVDFDLIKFILCESEEMNDLEATNIVKYKPKHNFTLPPNSKFKTMAYLKKRILEELPRVRSPYSKIAKAKQPKNQREHYYIASKDCDEIIKVLATLISDKYS